MMRGQYYETHWVELPEFVRGGYRGGYPGETWWVRPREIEILIEKRHYTIVRMRSGRTLSTSLGLQEVKERCRSISPPKEYR